MKKFTSLLFVALVVLFSAPVRAEEVPKCGLSGPTAMDTSRQLAEGETFTKTDRPLVVNLRFRPTKKHPQRVGECMLPSGTEVAVKNGVLQWVKECGNDEVNRNVFVTPLVLLKGDKGEPGTKGDKGDPGYTPKKGVDYWDGARGLQGPQGIPGRDASAVAVMWEDEALDDPAPPEEKGWWCSRHPVWCTIGVVAVTGVVIAALSGGGGGGGGGDAAVGTAPGGSTDGGGTPPGGTTDGGTAGGGGGPSGPNSF